MARMVVVVGTRPEIIQMASVIHELRARRADHVVIHTRQHYDENLSEVFFEELDLPRPDRNLDVGSGTQAEQTATALVRQQPPGLTQKNSYIGNQYGYCDAGRV